MTMLLQILRFLALAAIGYAGFFVVYVVGIYLVGHLPDDAHLPMFKQAYGGGGFMVAILGTALGLISFFTTGRTAKIFLAMPAALPIFYYIAVWIVFSV